MPGNYGKVMVVVPAYNEQGSIATVIQSLLALGLEVIVVDDGSEIEIKNKLSGFPVHVLRHSVNLGQGAALQTGIEFAIEKNADYIITFDADGQHNPGDIENLLQPLISKEAEITLGSRFLPGADHNMDRSRMIILKFGRYINFLFTGLFLSDTHNGLRAMTVAAAKKIQLLENRMAHASEILSQINQYKIPYAEVPVHITYSSYSRQKGQSSVNSFRIVFDLLLNKFFK
jgi:glycosyltransferase involved in cell wall biosynthesis